MQSEREGTVGRWQGELRCRRALYAVFAYLCPEFRCDIVLEGLLENQLGPFEN